MGRPAGLRLGAGVLLALLALGGCSGDDGGGDDGGEAAPPPSGAAPTAAASAPGTPGPTALGSPAATSRAPGAAATAAAPGTASGGAARPGGPAKAIWRPKAGVSWQWQLNGTVDTSVRAEVYDIDMAENSAATVAKLHAQGRKVICYVNVGAWEEFRADRERFPAAVRGKPVDGWPGEHWLDIRRIDVLRPIMAARLDECARKGFDGVEGDLMDNYTQDTGFPLTAAHQLAYNRMIADLAHSRGLAAGLKNDLGQIPQLVRHFEFAVNEQCFEFDECDLLKPFLDAGKPVFHAEYDLEPASYCAESRRLRLSSVHKDLDLTAARTPC